jgi:hypothetical protein
MREPNETKSLHGGVQHKYLRRMAVSEVVADRINTTELDGVPAFVLGGYVRVVAADNVAELRIRVRYDEAPAIGDIWTVGIDR